MRNKLDHNSDVKLTEVAGSPGLYMRDANGRGSDNSTLVFRKKPDSAFWERRFTPGDNRVAWQTDNEYTHIRDWIVDE